MGCYAAQDHEDIIARTDRVLLCALVATGGALNHADITDPYELYQYIRFLRSERAWALAWVYDERSANVQ